MGRLQKSRKSHPTRKIITFLHHVSKEKRNAPSQRLDHKETRSSRNSEKRNSPYMHQVTESRQNHPEKGQKMGRKLASLAQKPQAPEWGNVTNQPPRPKSSKNKAINKAIHLYTNPFSAITLGHAVGFVTQGTPSCPKPRISTPL
ncbi:hypothetical protein PIB30_076264 [Stylosanthes scabra]|uniref:Uncharacterized protein n=1 Tax=Stylosanthes scabra TaxID=79078 RepID=A0ABU6VR66_9FABA|nr:hypothetical protein [Stylosanthes scabra]